MRARRSSAGVIEACLRVVSQQLVQGDGQGADTAARGVEDRVGHGGGEAGQADLPDALGADRVGAVPRADELDLHVGDVGVHGNDVVTEGGVGDAPGAGVTDRLLEKSHPDAADRTADDLAARGLLVEDAAAVDDGEGPGDSDAAQVRVDVYLDVLRPECAGRHHAQFLRRQGNT